MGLGFASAKDSKVLVASLSFGRSIGHQTGPHKALGGEGWPDLASASHDPEDLGPRMLPPVARHSGWRPEDLQRFSGASQPRLCTPEPSCEVPEIASYVSGAFGGGSRGFG